MLLQVPFLKENLKVINFLVEIYFFKGINPEFQKHLRTLVPRLLDPNNIVVKCINGQPITCRELVVYFKV